MPASKRGDFENPSKSARSVERYESAWELADMQQLEPLKSCRWY